MDFTILITQILFVNIIFPRCQKNAQSNQKVNSEEWYDTKKWNTYKIAISNAYKIGIGTPTVKCKRFKDKLNSCKINKTLKIVIVIVL